MDKRILRERRIKFLAIVMSLLMVFGMLPVGAMAYNCGSDISHSFNLEGEPDKTTEANCKEPAYKIWYCQNYNDNGERCDEEYSVVVGESDETKHVWGPWCETNQDYVEVYRVILDSTTPLSPADCTSGGYHARRCTVCGQQDIEYVNALDPDWGEIRITWGENYGTCTARQECKRDPEEHYVEVTVNTTVSATTPATCEGKGSITYSADFTETDLPDAGIKTQTVETNPLNHDWNAPTYEWSKDNTTCTATRTCKNDTNNEHSETETVSISVKEDTTTCTAGGQITYTATFINTAFGTKDNTVTASAKGHDFSIEIPAKAATCMEDGYPAHKECSRCHVKDDDTVLHDENAHEWDEGIVTTPATCSATGIKTLTCKLNSQHTTPVEIPIDKNAHNWGEVTYSWSEDNATCTATRVCSLNPKEHIETETVNAVKTETAAKCEANGKITYTAKFKNTAFAEQTQTETTDPLGHVWKVSNWYWAPDYEYATADFSCQRNGCNVSIGAVPGEVSETEITPAGCETNKVVTYTATVTVPESEEEVYDKKENVEIPETATGHAWEFKEFTWTAGGDAGYTVTASFTCKNNSSHTTTAQMKVTSETTPATCTEAGKIVYTATLAAADSPDGQPRSDTKTVTIPIDENAHVCEFKGFTWTAGGDAGYTVTASFTCKNNSSHTITAQMKVTSETTPATCTEAGKIVYTATLAAADSPDGQSRSDTKTVTIPIDENAHDWDDGVITTPATCSATGVKTLTCRNNPQHTTTVEIPIDENAHDWDDGVITTPATCSAAGVKTLTCQLNSQHTTTVEIPIDENAHDWDEGEVTTPATCSATGVKTLTCKNNSQHTTPVEIPIDANAHDWDEGEVTTPATCSATGVKTLTCKLNSQHTTPVEIPIDENAHDWGDTTYVWSDDCSTCTATRICKRNANHIETEETVQVTETTEPATCENAGKTIYTAKFSNPAFGEQTKEIPISALGHDLERQPAVQPTENADGNTEHWKCTRCGGLFLDADGKKPTTKEIVTIVKTAIITRIRLSGEEPTCEKAGMKECWFDPANNSFYDAAEGGNILRQEDLPIPPLEHDWGEWTTVTEPTLTEPGTEMHTCARCGKEETRPIPRTGKDGDIHTIGSLQFTIHDLDAGTVYVSRWNGTEEEGEELTIPDTVMIDGVQFSVTGIRKGAFQGNGLIKKLILGERVEVIEKEAFMGCTGLTVVNAMRCEKLRFIGESAFEGCEHLNTVLMNVAALETLEKNAFAGIDEAAAFDLFCLEETENNLAAAAALIRTEETGWLSTMSLAAYRYYDSSFEQYDKIDEGTLVINDQIVTHP